VRIPDEALARIDSVLGDVVSRDGEMVAKSTPAQRMI
jgi:hypothetical protein